MVIMFPPHVLARLAAIEADEGVPPVEIVHQAVEVWSRLNADERGTLGFAALHLVVSRLRGNVQ